MLRRIVLRARRDGRAGGGADLRRIHRRRQKLLQHLDLVPLHVGEVGYGVLRAAPGVCPRRLVAGMPSARLPPTGT